MFNSTLTPVVAERDQSKIVLFFHRKQTPPTLHRELSEHISADTWASRLPQILRLTARYNHPIPEAARILIYFILAIVLPTVIDPILIAHFAPDTFAERRTNQSFFTAHVIAMGLFLALTLAFWGPLLAFKALGQQRANVLARRWAAEDARGSKYSGYVPFWQIRLPGVVRNQTRVTINLPSKPQPTLYHPQAYLPSWIGAPASPALEKSPTLDALPMYDDAGRPHSFMFDEKAPAYGAAAYKV